MEKLLQPADAVVLGNFLSSRSVQMEDGLIATEVMFKIDQEWGVEAQELGIAELKVYYPGGSWKGHVSQIEGAPHFNVGEKSMLFLKAQPDGSFWIQGLGMGVFRVVRMGAKTVLINSIFPSEPELSRWELDKFVKKLSEVKGASFKEVFTDKYMREMQKETTHRVTAADSQTGNYRRVASSDSQSDNGAGLQVSNSSWLLFTLGLLGALFGWWGRQKTR